MAVGLVSGDSLARTANLPDPDEWTITGWFKQTADLDEPGVVAAIAHGSMSNYATVSISSDGTTIAAAGNGGLNNLSPQPGVGSWYFFSIVRTAGDTFTVYWSLEGSSTFNSATGTCGSFVPGLILFGSTSGFETQGHYQYLRCWNANLSQVEIEAERFSATPVTTSGLNFVWRLNDNTDTADLSGNSRNPTIAGSPTTQTGPNLSVSSAATLSNPTPSGTLETETTASVGCTTDQATGTLYVVVDSAANMAGITDAQVIAGTNANDATPVFNGSAAVSTTSPSVGVTGLSANTAYSYAIVQDNDNGESNVLTGTFTTAEAGQEAAGTGAFGVAIAVTQAGTGQSAVRKLRLTEANDLELRSEIGVLLNISGVNFEWYDKFGNTTGDPDITGTIDIVNGEAVIPLFGSSLSASQPGTLILYHPSLNTVNGLYRLAVE